MTVAPVSGRGTFTHAALIIERDEDLPAAAAPYLRGLLGHGQDGMLIVSERTRSLLAPHLAGTSGTWQWRNPAAGYRRLGHGYEALRRLLAARHAAGQPLHVVSEPILPGDAGREAPAGRAAAYLAYEAACNDAYAPYEGSITCLWDSRRHPALVEDIRATHAYELKADGAQVSDRYQPPDRFLAGHRDQRLPRAPADLDQQHTLDEVRQLSTLRTAIASWAAERGFDGDAADDIVVATTEVAVNGLRHGGTPVQVSAWHDNGTLVVQCDDTGTAEIPALAGYVRPDPVRAQPNGRGLWMARQLADVVVIDSSRGRTRVRLHFPHALMHRPAC